MAARAQGLAIGIVFGFMLSWSGMANPDVIRDALLFRESYLYLFMFSAVATAGLGLWVLRAARNQRPPREPVERRHLTGSLMFGAGWGLAGACPGPIAAQLGQGIGWSLVIAAGVFGGVFAYLKHQAPETEPATDAPRDIRKPGMFISGRPAPDARSPRAATPRPHPRRSPAPQRFEGSP